MNPSLHRNSAHFTLLHQGRPQPPRRPENLATSLQPRRSHPTSPQSPPASPQIRIGSFSSCPVTRASNCPQARIAFSTPRQPPPRLPSPSHLSREAARRLPLLPRFQLGGPEALLPITQSPSHGHTAQSAASSGLGEGPEPTAEG